MASQVLIILAYSLSALYITVHFKVCVVAFSAVIRLLLILTAVCCSAFAFGCKLLHFPVIIKQFCTCYKQDQALLYP